MLRNILVFLNRNYLVFLNRKNWSICSGIRCSLSPESPLTSILTFGGIKYDVDCKSRKYDKQFHLHVNGLGEFTFDETGENMVYSTIDYDSKLLKKLHNIVEVWERRFHYF